MKTKSFLFAILSMICISSKAQNTTSIGGVNSIQVNKGGIEADSAVKLPSRFPISYTLRDSTGYIWIQGGILYYHDGTSRIQVSTGGPTPTLQSITDAGNSTSNPMTINDGSQELTVGSGSILYTNISTENQVELNFHDMGTSYYQIFMPTPYGGGASTLAAVETTDLTQVLSNTDPTFGTSNVALFSDGAFGSNSVEISYDGIDLRQNSTGTYYTRISSEPSITSTNTCYAPQEGGNLAARQDTSSMLVSWYQLDTTTLNHIIDGTGRNKINNQTLTFGGPYGFVNLSSGGINSYTSGGNPGFNMKQNSSTGDGEIYLYRSGNPFYNRLIANSNPAFSTDTLPKCANCLILSSVDTGVSKTIATNYELSLLGLNSVLLNGNTTTLTANWTSGSLNASAQPGQFSTSSSSFASSFSPSQFSTANLSTLTSSNFSYIGISWTNTVSGTKSVTITPSLSTVGTFSPSIRQLNGNILVGKEVDATLSSGVVTISDANTTANSHATISYLTPSGAIGAGFKVSYTAGTGYTVTSIKTTLGTETSDNSTIRITINYN